MLHYITNAKASQQPLQIEIILHFNISADTFSDYQEVVATDSRQSSITTVVRMLLSSDAAIEAVATFGDDKYISN